MRLYRALRGCSCGSRGFRQGPDDGHNSEVVDPSCGSRGFRRVPLEKKEKTDPKPTFPMAVFSLLQLVLPAVALAAGAGKPHVFFLLVDDCNLLHFILFP